MLQGWNKATCNSMSRGGVKVETIYWNYNLSPGDIAEFTYAGRDFTDRQRIKRKVCRTLAKFKQLPELERNMILTELYKHYPPALIALYLLAPEEAYLVLKKVPEYLSDSTPSWDILKNFFQNFNFLFMPDFEFGIC